MSWKIISYEYCLVFLFISDMRNDGDNFTVWGTRDPPPPKKKRGKMSLKQIHTCRFCLLVADKSWHELAMLCILSVQEKFWKRFWKWDRGEGGVGGVIVALWRWGAGWSTDNSKHYTCWTALNTIVCTLHCKFNCEPDCKQHSSVCSASGVKGKFTDDRHKHLTEIQKHMIDCATKMGRT